MVAESYPFASSDDERRRLIAQGELLGPQTERLFKRAGIASGLHVLDVGAGSGDVSFLAARMVGPDGSVTGVDRDPGQVEFARQRAEAQGLDNVRFVSADFRELELASPVDAIVGRLVLMYTAAPVEALRACLRNLKADGIVAILESIYSDEGPVLIEPTDCLAAKVVDWIRAGLKYSGVQSRMGMRLFGVMRAAGLRPALDIEMTVPILQGPEGPLFPALASVVRSQIAAIVASGAATKAEIDIDTLEQRLAADAPASGVVGYFNLGHIGMWARKP
jgi:SAM-dependent methyltransferase